MKTTYTIHPDGGRSVTQYGVPEILPRHSPARSAPHAMARYLVDLVRVAVSFTVLLCVLAACGAVLVWVAGKVFPALVTSWILIAALFFGGLALWVFADK